MPTTIHSYSLAALRALTAAEVTKLKQAGIDSTTELVAAAPTTSKEQALAKKVGISPDRLREAVNRADLVRVSGIGPARADLFENAGVNSAKELAMRNASALTATLAKYLKAHPELSYRLPSPSTVASLIEKARQTVDAAGPGAPTPTVVAKHLKIAVVRWYMGHRADVPPGANTAYQAQMAVQAKNVEEVKDPAEDPHGHDFAKYQVFRHPDVVFPGSDTVWFAVFERGTGKFVETYDFN